MTDQTALQTKRSSAAGAMAVLGGVGLIALCGMAVWRHLNRYQFGGRIVLIAGGSRGLGLVMARQLAAEGARVCLCARDGEELDRAHRELNEMGYEVLSCTCDISDERDVREMVRWIEQRWGPVDVLINCAGVIRVGPIEAMTEDDYEYMLDVHLRGPLNTINAVTPGMRQRGGGRIVNVASIGGLMPIPHLTPYCASKHALVGLSQGLRLELKKNGIVVTTACPGLMRTGSQAQAEFKGQHRREYAWFSISASLPLASESAERAAAQIINACRYGKARVTLTFQAKVAALANAVAPGPTSWLLELVNRALPGDGGIHDQVAKGLESQSVWSPSLLTVLGDRAARRNNELDPARRHNGRRRFSAD